MLGVRKILKEIFVVCWCASFFHSGFFCPQMLQQPQHFDILPFQGSMWILLVPLIVFFKLNHHKQNPQKKGLACTTPRSLDVNPWKQVLVWSPKVIYSETIKDGQSSS